MRAGLLGALAMATTLTGCVTDDPPSAAVMAAPRRPLNDTEKAMIANAVSGTLKDPASAQFKWAPLVVNTRDGVTDYCGLVNAKNSYGGYVGYAPFYVQIVFDEHGKIKLAELRGLTNPSDDATADIESTLCREFGYGDLSNAV